MASIRQSAPTNLDGRPNVSFDKSLFDASIWSKGYSVNVHKAIECPCRGTNENKPDPTCKNCGGLGWVFINPVHTMAIITGVNRDTKYKAWSEELIGNVSVTLRDIDQAGFMDRITMNDETGIFSEVKKARVIGESVFVFLSYEIKEVQDVYVFLNGDQKLIRLDEGEWTINTNNPYCLNIAAEAMESSSNGSISVRYRHPVQYNILDIPHLIRSSNVKNTQGQIEKVKLPNQYVARLAHYVLRPLFDGSGIINNDYDQ